MKDFSDSRFVWDEGDIDIVKRDESDDELIRPEDVRVENGKVKIVSGSFASSINVEDNNTHVSFAGADSVDSLGNIFDPGSFYDVLNDLLRIKKISNAEAYTRAQISRQTFSKMLNPGNRPPGKELIFAIAIGMRLNVVELDRLLYSAGYIRLNNQFADKLVFEYISARKWDIFEINEMLEDAGFDILGSKTRGKSATEIGE